jgi:NADH:ubiquinone oxidoreductase subunit 5 (subunit L)/multisubunit Na+/H+ antiporter MnhA subunit
LDVYSQSPTIITVWLTIIAKLTVFVFLFNLIDVPSFTALQEILWRPSNAHLLTSGPIAELIAKYPSIISEKTVGDTSINTIKQLLLICSLLSLIIGTVLGLSQTNIKRLLAFSSISHVGFLLLALAIFTPKSVDSFFFYLIQYSLTSLTIFLILLAFGYVLYNNSEYISKNTDRTKLPGNTVTLSIHKEFNVLDEFKGLFVKNPILSLSLAICLFSMAGIPPFIGFFSKQFVLLSSIQNGNYFISIVAILVSVISASYYLKIIQLMFFDKPADTVTRVITEGNPNDNKAEAEVAVRPQVKSVHYFTPNSVLIPSASSHTRKLANLKVKAGVFFFSSSIINSVEVVSLGRNTLTLNASAISAKANEENRESLSNLHSYTISVLTFIIAFFFLDPTIILNGTQLITLTIFNL